MIMSSSRSSPPWEVVVLVAHRLDPKTLAQASCVSKSWLFSMSSDHIWEPLCFSHYPSLTTLHHPRVPYHRLFALGFSASKTRLRTPSSPRLALHDLFFAVDVRAGSDRVFASAARPAHELEPGPGGVFRFDIDLRGKEGFSGSAEGLEEARITWNVVLRGWGGAFTMMECGAGVNYLPGAEGWFSEELPSPGCCSSSVVSGLVADLKLGFGGGGVDRVSLGMLSVLNWRYVTVEDGLRYLHHFLLPTNSTTCSPKHHVQGSDC